MTATLPKLPTRETEDEEEREAGKGKEGEKKDIRWEEGEIRERKQTRFVCELTTFLETTYKIP